MSNIKFSIKGYILVPEEDLPAVLEQLPEHTRLTREEPGCLVFDVSQNADNPLRFDVHEEFVNVEAFRAHQTRMRTTPWYPAAINAERHYEVQGGD